MNWKSFLVDKGIAFEIVSHRDTYDSQHLAEAMHVPGRHVAKTVLLRADRGFAYVVAVLPATKLVDLQRLSAALGGSRLEFATEAEIAEHCPDCEFGVLPPFGSQYGMRTMLDADLAKETWMVFEGSTHHDAVRMSVSDFQRVEQPLLVHFAIDPQPASTGRE